VEIKFYVLVQRKNRSNKAAIGILTRQLGGCFTVAAQYRNRTELPQFQLQQLTTDGGASRSDHNYSSELSLKSYSLAPQNSTDINTQLEGVKIVEFILVATGLVLSSGRI
jgi:hypothetical protein